MSYTEQSELRNAARHNPHVTSCYTPFFVELPQSSNSLTASVYLKGPATAAWLGCAALLSGHYTGPARGARGGVLPRPYFF